MFRSAGRAVDELLDGRRLTRLEKSLDECEGDATPSRPPTFHSLAKVRRELLELIFEDWAGHEGVEKDLLKPFADPQATRSPEENEVEFGKRLGKLLKNGKDKREIASALTAVHSNLRVFRPFASVAHDALTASRFGGVGVLTGEYDAAVVKRWRKITAALTSHIDAFSALVSHLSQHELLKPESVTGQKVV